MIRYALLFVVACGGAKAPPVVEPPPAPPPVPVRPEVPAKPAVVARQDFVVGESPMSLVAHRGTLYFTDSAGSVWSMPATGGEPMQLSDQKAPGFAFRLFVAGDVVFATTKKDLLVLAGPDGAVKRAGIAGLVGNVEEAAGGGEFAYVTVFKRPEVMRVPVRGGKAHKIGALPRGVLGVHGEVVYAASYATGDLVAIEGGKTRTIARGFVRPTAVAADEDSVFVYSEREQTVTRVGLGDGAKQVIAKGLVNSDDLLADGEWLYAFTWGERPALLRIAKDGSGQRAIAEDLKSPYRIAVDGEAVYVTSRDQNTIVRLVKAALD